MTVTTTRSVSNGNVIYTIAITVEQARGDLLAAEASRAIYESHESWWLYDAEGGRIEWDDLTNPQKIALLGKFAQLRLKQAAHQRYVDELRAALVVEYPDARYGT